MTTTPSAPHDAGDDLLRILDQLSDMIAGARSVPMSASAMVNREEALDLVERARQAVPTAVRRADDIVADADAVLSRGRQESERLVARAQEEADRLVAGENVVRLANDRADLIVATAERKAAELRHGADDYSDRSLAALEIEVGRLADQIRAGRQVLVSRLEPETQADRETDREADGEGGDRDGAPRGAEGQRRFAGWSVDPAQQR